MFHPWQVLLITVEGGSGPLWVRPERPGQGSSDGTVHRVRIQRILKASLKVCVDVSEMFQALGARLDLVPEKASVGFDGIA